MGNKKYNVGTVHLSEIQSFFLALFSSFKISHPVFYSSESGETFMISRVVTAVSNISSIFSERCVSDFSMRSRSGLVTGCFATKVVQQSSYGKIEVSNVLIFSAISMISCSGTISRLMLLSRRVPKKKRILFRTERAFPTGKMHGEDFAKIRWLW